MEEKNDIDITGEVLDVRDVNVFDPEQRYRDRYWFALVGVNIRTHVDSHLKLGKAGHVYVVYDEGRAMCKIGMTRKRRPMERAQQVKSASGTRHAKVWISPRTIDAFALEAEAHLQFSAKHHAGEWFNIPFDAAVSYVMEHVDPVTEEMEAAEKEELERINREHERQKTDGMKQARDKADSDRETERRTASYLIARNAVSKLWRERYPDCGGIIPDPLGRLRYAFACDVEVTVELSMSAACEFYAQINLLRWKIDSSLLPRLNDEAMTAMKNFTIASRDFDASSDMRGCLALTSSLDAIAESEVVLDHAIDARRACATFVGSAPLLEWLDGLFTSAERETKLYNDVLRTASKLREEAGLHAERLGGVTKEERNRIDIFCDATALYDMPLYDCVGNELSDAERIVLRDWMKHHDKEKSSAA